ncbi:hypothetical protein [Reinekea blandensis]|uniref:Uncharacterized protein n=1 Tax=Reinekea blandensis MED297 TaxID=314283 RepID=A4BDN3_9GAMM|nr:hypothetical protein [Reinekea blandensis]EAR09642.1 hypothetical protein MED297_15824 [Reinekea blandensis MED297]
MIRRIQFNIVQRPAWQRFLIFAASIAIVAVLFWIGLILVFGLAFVALVIGAINYVKLKVTGRPLFKGPQHFHRYQSQFTQHNTNQSQEKPSGQVIEGEVVDKDDK